MLRDPADVNKGPALPVGAVGRDRTKRVAGHVERDGRQNPKTLLQKQTSGCIVFIHSSEYR